jgi:hypothetical protein
MRAHDPPVCLGYFFFFACPFLFFTLLRGGSPPDGSLRPEWYRGGFGIFTLTINVGL